MAAANECTSVVGHFDGHGGAPVRYEVHCPILPNAAWPGLHQKPLDAAIGWLLAPYRPGGRQGDNQHNDYETCTHFAGPFDGHCDAPVLYRAHRPMVVFSGFYALAPKLWKGHRNAANSLYFKSFRCRRWRDRAVWLRSLLGVWHINGKPRTWRMHRNTYMGWLI